MGTAVEVNLTKEFEFANGDDLDWKVAGLDVDCKFSKDLGGWEIPMEMYLCEDHGARQGKANHPALLTWLNDDTNQWAAGLITITDERLRWRVDKESGERSRGYNRDNKRRLADSAKSDIYWLWGGMQRDLPRNLLLHLDAAARERVFSHPRSGQARVDQLFREVQDTIVSRQMVVTVAQQDDAPKRARDARLHLRKEGVLILGHQESHPSVARRPRASRSGEGRVDRGPGRACRGNRFTAILQHRGAAMGASSAGRARDIGAGSSKAPRHLLALICFAAFEMATIRAELHPVARRSRGRAMPEARCSIDAGRNHSGRQRSK